MNPRLIAILALLLAGAPELVSAQTVITYSASARPDKEKKPKPTPSPTPIADARRDWGNTGTDFNTNANWAASTGGLAPGVSDVAYFTSAAVVQPNLSASLSISGLYFFGTGSSGYNITRTNNATFTLTGYDQVGLNGTNDSGAAAIRAENTSGTNTIAVPLILAPASGTTSQIFQASGGTLNISGVISGSGISLAKNGTGNTGTLGLSGANTYTGGTFLGNTGGSNFGTLSLGTSSIGGPGSMTSGPFGTGTLTLRGTIGSTIQSSDSTTRTISNAIAIAGSNFNTTFAGTGDLIFDGTMALGTGARTFTISNTNTTFSGVISNSGDILKAGTGTMILSGANTYTGRTAVQNGTLSINSIKNLSTTSAVGAPVTVATGTIAMGDTATTGTLKYTGTGDITNRVVDLAGTTGGAVIDQSGTGLLKFTSNFTATGNGSKTLTLQGSTAGTGEIGGRIVDASATNKTSLLKTGTGTWTISGANTYTGGTTINQGTLIAGVGSLVSVGGGITVNNGGTLLLSGIGRHIGNAVPVTLNGGTFDTGGLSEPTGALDGTRHIGSLTLTASSTISFGAGNSSILEFGGLGTHIAGTMLNIVNWDGVPLLGGSGDRLLFNGLATDFVGKYNQSDVTFDGVTGYATIQVALGADPFYEVVGLAAVPEPGTWVGGGLAFIVLAWTQRRRFAPSRK